MPRLLLVFAHPDDEVLAVGGRLERLSASQLLTITDGAPGNGADAQQHGFASLEAYRAERRAELLAALADANLPAEIAPVFAGAVADQAAALHLAALTRALAVELDAFAPEAVLTHPFEGGHPDHDACAFAVHAALRLPGKRLKLRGRIPVFEAPSYHADGRGGMATGRFLQQVPAVAATQCDLNAQEQKNKRRRLAYFRSQATTLAQFGLGWELFREAPAYDFTRRPHPGKLFYEHFAWGMDGDRFCGLAAHARHELFGEPADGDAQDGVPGG